MTFMPPLPPTFWKEVLKFITRQTFFVFVSFKKGGSKKRKKSDPDYE